MKNLNVKRYSLVLSGVFAVCFCVVAYQNGKTVFDFFNLVEILEITYKAVPLVLIVVSVFVGYAWRWKMVQGWLVPFPDLNGTWQGEIQTTWKNPDTEEIPKPIPVILSVKQSFIHVSCVMRTAEMTSRSYLADFWLDCDQQMRKLGYSYTSKPSPMVSERSKPHDGTIVFDLIGEPVEKLKGVYWAERKTTGEVVLTFRGKKRLEEFPDDLGKHPVSGN